MKKLLLKGGQVYENGNLEKRDVLIEDGIIKSVKNSIEQRSTTGFEKIHTLDMAGKIISPGFVDVHCHIRTPGQEYKEDIKSASQAAVRGGFTHIMTMANTNPVVDNIEVINCLKARIKEESDCHILLVGAVTKGLKGQECVNFAEMAKEVAAFSDDGMGVQDSTMMDKAFRHCKELGKIIISHCEYELDEPGAINEGPTSEALNIKGINNKTEWEMVERELSLASVRNAKVHIAHVSTKESVELIRQAKEKGVQVTAEACPHHYLLTDKEALTQGSLAKVNPPLRTEEDRLAILEGVKTGVIDCIATDHAPHSEEEKNLPIDKAPFGMVGLETAVPLTLDLVNKDQLTIERVIESMGVLPYKIFNIPGGKVEAGQPANLTVLALQDEFQVDKNKFYSKGKNTPFQGLKGKGDVHMTIVDGQIKYKKEELKCL